MCTFFRERIDQQNIYIFFYLKKGHLIWAMITLRTMALSTLLSGSTLFLGFKQVSTYVGSSREIPFPRNVILHSIKIRYRWVWLLLFFLENLILLERKNNSRLLIFLHCISYSLPPSLHLNISVLIEIC